MKKLKLVGMILPFFMILQFSLIFQSCKKDSNQEQPVVRDAAISTGYAKNSLPHAKQYSAEVATSWFTLLSEITKTKPYPSPQILRIMAYSGVALYESVVPGMPSYQSIYAHLTGNTIEPEEKKKDYYWPACANAALARISTKIMQSYPAPNLTQVQALEASFNQSFQSKVSSENLQLSNEFGRHVGDVIFEWSKTDGTFNPDGSLAVCPPYVPLGGPGNWEPTPPGFLPGVGACQGSLRTFIPNIVNDALAAPHPVYSTDPASTFYQAANETFQARNNATPEQANLYLSWRDAAGNYHPLTHVVKVTTAIIIKEDVDLEEAVTIYAKQNMAAYDAINTVFKSKFHYALIRPITYIRGVMNQPAWNSITNTSQHPSYPDESSATAASVKVLESYFGTSYAFIDSTQKALYGSFSYPSLAQFANAIVDARVNGGTIFRFCGDAGIIQGRKVGQMINALPFKK